MNKRKNAVKRSSEMIKRILEENPEHILAHSDKKQAKLIHNNSIDMQKWFGRRRGKFKEIMEEGTQTAEAMAK